MKQRILSCHFNLLAYHAARYEAFLSEYARDFSLDVLLVRPTKEYLLFRQDLTKNWNFTVYPSEVKPSDEVFGNAQKKLISKIESINPDIILLPGGYAEIEMLYIIRWAIDKRKPIILCSETKLDDAKRIWIKEWVKKLIFRYMDAFLVGGTPHREYKILLGAKKESIFLGYDAVDNHHFSKAIDLRAQERSENTSFSPYFLASNRFEPRKNIERLVKAYQQYRSLVGPSAWGLVLIGDGQERKNIARVIEEEGVRGVELKGFLQIEALPKIYAGANCFIHPAVQEQWGLVVNEAMAAGLPVLVSEKTGCRYDLVEEGKNGFLFNPESIDDISDKLVKMHNLNPSSRTKMGLESLRIISDWGAARFSEGLHKAISYVLNLPLKKKKGSILFDGLISTFLIRQWMS